MKEWIFQYWLQAVFGLAITLIAYVVKRLNKKLKEQEYLKLALQAMLRDRIIESYNKYNKEGYCPIYIRDNIQELATQYFNLGGNGVIHELLDKIKVLPTELKE